MITGALRQTGRLFALAAEVVRAVFRRPFQFREFVEQFWFVASVTILPAALVSIPFGAVIALQVGSLTEQLGAQSFTGGASVLAVVQQASPLIVALLIAGAGGSAICADLGSRRIREELDAMEVMGVSPVQRLVVPRVLAAMGVAVLLNGLVSVVGILGGYFFNVIMQGGTPAPTSPASPPSPSCPTSTSANSRRWSSGSSRASSPPTGDSTRAAAPRASATPSTSPSSSPSSCSSSSTW